MRQQVRKHIHEVFACSVAAEALIMIRRADRKASHTDAYTAAGLFNSMQYDAMMTQEASNRTEMGTCTAVVSDDQA